MGEVVKTYALESMKNAKNNAVDGLILSGDEDIRFKGIHLTVLLTLWILETIKLLHSV